MTLDGAEYELQAEEDINALMVQVEASDLEGARDVVNELAGDGMQRLAWALLRCATMLHAQEALGQGMATRLTVANGLTPVGLSPDTVARIAFGADRIRAEEEAAKAARKAGKQ